MKRRSLFFVAPRQVEVRDETLTAGLARQVLVQTVVSAISPGTEMLIYRGQAPAGMAADAAISALSGDLDFPLKYGYACVGRVLDTGRSASSAWRDQFVFAFHPHESHFWADPAELFLLPAELSPEDAVFLPNMETAVNFLHDGQPLIGERVLVFGQGIVGLLTTALLARLPLAMLATLDRYPTRRRTSLDLGSHISLNPDAPAELEQLRSLLRQDDMPGADLIYELSGAPEALDLAIPFAGFGGRIVIGSWYGAKRAGVDLGGHFHRSRLRLISSQVSSVAPELSGRWSKTRRLSLAEDWLVPLRPSQLITHRFSIQQAAEAYRLIDRRPDTTLQVIFTYD